jgi:hypothetical protein
MLFTKYYHDRVKENGIGEICSTNDDRETSQKILFHKLICSSRLRRKAKTKLN